MGGTRGRHSGPQKQAKYGRYLAGALVLAAVLWISVVAVLLHGSGSPARTSDTARPQASATIATVPPVATSPAKPLQSAPPRASPAPKKTYKPPARKTMYGQYVVQPGDTLESIARYLYRNPDDWKYIAKSNKSFIDQQGGVIYAGEVLLIPILQS
jgi:nucleoid-associated protein YgaU